MAWVLYAERFRLRINSTVYTFNIMINVLCKSGKLKKAKEFIGCTEGLGFNLNVVTYNTIIHGHCGRGNLEGAKGIEPDSHMGRVKKESLRGHLNYFVKWRKMG